MSRTDLNDLKLRLRDFAEARDWDDVNGFTNVAGVWIHRSDQLTRMDALMTWAHGCAGTVHSPKNLSMALSAEAAEILEHFQWLTEEQGKSLPKDKHDEVETELAHTDIGLIKGAESKIRLNEQKYPVWNR